MYSWSRMPSALKEQVFEELERLAAKANLSESDYYAYQKAVDRFSVNRQIEEDIKNKGRAERDIEIASKMKRQGYSVDVITEITGLSEEEIERL